MAQGPARISSGSSAWVDITGKPSTFPPSAHTHPATDVTEDTTHRFATDMEKTTWNAKVSFPGFGTTAGTAAEGNDARLSDARNPLAHTQAWSTITSTPTTLAGYGITDAQGLDSDLTALAGLSTSGILARTGAGTAATRAITGTTDQVVVTNGDGVSGNPTLALPQDIATTSTPQFRGLGIGTAGSSSYAVDVLKSGGTAGTYVLRFVGGDTWHNAMQFSNTTSNTYAFMINGSARSPVGAFTIFDVTNLADRLVITTSGALRFPAYGAGTLVTDSSGNITASSDASLKTVTGSFTRGLADVLKLTPRTYHWNEKSGMDTDDENVGFIAQEVLEAIPESVGQYRTSEVEVDGKKTKKREKAELLTLSDRPLIAALVNAVKELKAENGELSARIAKLEGKK